MIRNGLYTYLGNIRPELAEQLAHFLATECDGHVGVYPAVYIASKAML